MHDKYAETAAVRQDTDVCDNRINAPQAAKGTVSRLRTADELHQIEKDATNELYRTVAEFTVEPNDFNQRMVYLKLEQFRDAWMAGRRRVMD